jgi:hypothetical protein
MDNSQLMSRRIKRGYKVIVSVYPAAPPPIERPFDGWTQFTLPACPKGTAPQIFKVADAVQFTTDEMDRTKIRENLIFAEQVAQDLLDHWARTPMGGPPGSGPGIGLIAGDAPTEAELQVLLARQQAMFEWLYHEGMRMAQAEEWRGINRHHRMAAEWLGLEEPWARDPRKKGNQPCPACTVPISTDAFICPNCHTVLRALPAEILELNQPRVQRAR